MTPTAQPDPHTAATQGVAPGHCPGRTIGITRAQLALAFRPAGPPLTIAGTPIARDHTPRARLADRGGGHEDGRDRVLVWH